MDDVVLVTVHCWRLDALTEMPQLSNPLGDRGLRRMTTRGAATNELLPILLASEYPMSAYAPEESLASGIQSIRE